MERISFSYDYLFLNNTSRQLIMTLTLTTKSLPMGKMTMNANKF